MLHDHEFASPLLQRAFRWRVGLGDSRWTYVEASSGTYQRSPAMLTECKRNGRHFDLSVLSDDQLALFQRAADNGAEIDGTTYLSVVDFSDQEVVELQKGLLLVGVLRKGERFK